MTDERDRDPADAAAVTAALKPSCEARVLPGGVAGWESE